jgi:hypothetical protein
MLKLSVSIKGKQLESLQVLRVLSHLISGVLTLIIYYIMNIRKGEKFTKDKDIRMSKDLVNDSLKCFCLLIFG